MSKFGHQSAGRVTVEPGKSSITLHLLMWGMKPDATLGLEEAELLIRHLREAIDRVKAGGKKRATSAPVADDDYSDIA